MSNDFFSNLERLTKDPAFRRISSFYVHPRRKKFVNGIPDARALSWQHCMCSLSFRIGD